MKVEKLLEQAQQKCQQAGVRFTDKRSQILKTLLVAKQPLSAYELLDLYNKQAEQSMQAMSAYRILDLFVELNLIHKLTSSNKYIACAHLACQHAHHDQYFVVCNHCGETREVDIPQPLLAQLEKSVADAGFYLQRTQFELDCLCNGCRAALETPSE